MCGSFTPLPFSGFVRWGFSRKISTFKPVVFPETPQYFFSRFKDLFWYTIFITVKIVSPYYPLTPFSCGREKMALASIKMVKVVCFFIIIPPLCFFFPSSSCLRSWIYISTSIYHHPYIFLFFFPIFIFLLYSIFLTGTTLFIRTTVRWGTKVVRAVFFQ